MCQEPGAQRDVVRPPGFVGVERLGQQMPQVELDQPGDGDEPSDGEQVTGLNTGVAGGKVVARPSRDLGRLGPGDARTSDSATRLGLAHG